MEDIQDPDDGTLPQRFLNNFCFFDPSDSADSCFVTLDHLETGDTSSQLEGAGLVSPFDGDENAETGQAVDAVRMHLTAILSYTIDYLDAGT